MDKQTRQYRKDQFLKTDNHPSEWNRTLKITNQSKDGLNTNYLDITEEEYQAIKNILTKGV